jgi:hypothetical protein
MSTISQKRVYDMWPDRKPTCEYGGKQVVFDSRFQSDALNGQNSFG